MQKVCLSARRSRPLSREESLSYQTCCRVFLSHPKDHLIQLPPTTFKGMWIIYSNPETHRSLNIVSMYIFSHLSLHWIFLIYYNHSFIYDFMYSSLFFSVFFLQISYFFYKFYMQYSSLLFNRRGGGGAPLGHTLLYL